MTTEEIREAAKVMEAYANGKKIQYLNDDNEWIDTLKPFFDWHNYVYRIKPESLYRPFKTKEECWSEMLKHQPFGWVIGGKDYENFYHIEYVYSCNPYNYHRVKLSQNDMSFNYEHMFRDFTFIDGSPFGIKDE